MTLATRLSLAFALFAAFGATPMLAQQQRPITQDDLYHFKWVADPQISPDGKQVAYVLVTINAKHTGYETSLWIVPADASSPPRQITAGPRDVSPRWAPDSHTLALVRTEEKARPQIYVLSLQGGEARQLTNAPRGASSPEWSPDGKTIAFTSAVKPSDLVNDSVRSGNGRYAAADSANAEPTSDVRVITKAVFRSNGVGFLDLSRHRHIFTVPVDPTAHEPAHATEITSGDYDEGGVTWSADGSRIYFTADRVLEPYYYPPNSDVYSVPATGGSMTQVIDIDGPVRDAVPSPDGKSFAFAGFLNPPHVRSYNQTDLFVFANGQAKNLTAGYDYSVGGGPLGDQAPPRGGEGSSPVIWTSDGHAVIVKTGEHGASNLMRFDIATGQAQPLTTGDHDVMAYTATPDASTFALAIGDATHIGDIYAFSPATKQLTQLTHVNDSLFTHVTLSTPEQFWYRSFDGRRIEGWVLKPPGFTLGKKYPMILEIHGGPHTAYGATFFHEFQWMAAKGYVVLYANPRGSTSYGQEFGNIIQYRYPGDDYKDLMVAVDSLVRRGYVDPAHLGVTGGSGGGLLTNWTVTQTHRFAAAVSQRSVADWIGFWYTADFTLFTPSWFRSTPFQDPQEFLDRSPTRYAANITTPLMLIDGEEDLRTPPGQGSEAMFRALKVQHKPTVLVLFPRESHDLSRSGEPMHRVERLQHILNWFDKYLQGRPITEYDVH